MLDAIRIIQIFIAIAGLALISACNTAFDSQKVLTITLYSDLEPGVYALEKSDKSLALGEMLIMIGHSNEKRVLFRKSPNFNLKAWAYLHVGPDGSQRVCSRMVGYAADRPNGTSEIGWRVSECQVLHGGA